MFRRGFNSPHLQIVSGSASVYDTTCRPLQLPPKASSSEKNAPHFFRGNSRPLQLLLKIKSILLSKKIKVNREIRAPEVRLIDNEGKQHGVVKIQDAFSLAKEKGLDLVEVSSEADPPVVKLLDYGKQKYRMMKQQRKSKAKTKKVETKGVRIGLRTGDHDLQFKAKQATKFLKQGHRVKIEFVLKGREKVHRDLAEEKLDDFVRNMIQTNTVTVQKPKFMGMGLVSIITEGSKEGEEE